MIKNVLTHIGGVGGYGLVSLCIFFGFFVGMLWWAFRLKKSYLNAMRGLPLDGDPPAVSEPDRASNPQSRHE